MLDCSGALLEELELEDELEELLDEPEHALIPSAAAETPATPAILKKSLLE